MTKWRLVLGGAIGAPLMLAMLVLGDVARVTWAGRVAMVVCTIAVLWGCYFFAETVALEKQREALRRRQSARDEASEQPSIRASLETPTGRIIRQRVLERRGFSTAEALEQIADERLMVRLKARP